MILEIKKTKFTFSSVTPPIQSDNTEITGKFQKDPFIHDFVKIWETERNIVQHFATRKERLSLIRQKREVIELIAGEML